MKKYAIAFLLILSGGAAQAAPIYGTVRISTATVNIPPQQSGAMNVNSINGTISVSTLTAISSFTATNATLNNVTIASESVTASTIATATVSSGTVTIFNNALQHYRRPTLIYVSGNTIAISTGPTSNTATVIFPDGAVYSESGSSFIQMFSTQTANWGNGTMQGGIRPGEFLTNNTTLGFYAVKSTATGNTSDFTVVASTWPDTSQNLATLNGFFGTNGWEYLGMWRYGNSGGMNNAFLTGWQVGNFTMLTSSLTANSANNMMGYNLAGTSAQTSMAWGYQVGMSSATIPPTATYCLFNMEQASGAGILQFYSSNGPYFVDMLANAPNHLTTSLVPCVPVLNNIWNVNPNTSTGINLNLTGWLDSALSGGGNPFP